MAQNTSHAVMAQRVEASDSLDDFPTPPHAVRAFCEWLKPSDELSVWEPAANRGFMVKALRDYFGTVYASDVHDYGSGYPVHDFLMHGLPIHNPDFIITNPPFRLAEEFVHRALAIAPNVAIIVRSVWAEGFKRYSSIFEENPPDWILQHVERVAMVKGRYDPDASTATSYSWFFWHGTSLREKDTRFGWLPPSRKRLFRPNDVFPEDKS